MHMMGEVAAQANFNQLALKKDDKSGKFLPDTCLLYTSDAADE